MSMRAGELGLDDLRAGTLRWVVVLCWVTALGCIAYLPGISFAPLVQNWILAVILLVTGLVAWNVLGSSPRGAALLLFGGLLLCAFASIFLYPSSAAACTLSVVVVAASVLIGPWAGLTVALTGSVVILAVTQQRSDVLSDDIALVSLFLIWSNSVLAFLGAQPLYAALHWAWSSLTQAQEMIKQLRDSRGELGRTSKSLQEACLRLEQLNAELDRARRSAEEARRQKAEFAAAVSHELRTPLNLIIGFSEMMILSPEASYGERLPETYRDDIEAIYRNAAHISHLVDDILDLSQVEAHRMGLHTEKTTLAQIVDEALAAIGTLFRDKGLYLKACIPSSLPSVQVDPTRIRQVLLNLLSNAARFTDDGGVTVGAECNGHEITVSVADTGVGIAPDELPMVFREFRQLGRTAGHGGGSGLGLAVSKRLIELHGGSMWVESQPGKGSTFYFTLPLTGTVVASPFESDEGVWLRMSRHADGCRVLAVLDDTQGGEATRVFQRYLDRVEVKRVRSVREASRLAQAGRAQALLVASDSNGYARLVRDRKGLPDVPVIACSLRGVMSAYQGIGAQAYLVKPVAREHLLTSLRRVASQARRVLIVDDDPDMVRLLAQMARTSSRRYDVYEATGGEIGLRLLHEVSPDVVVLDLIMPDVDGYQFVEIMRADSRFRETPVVVVTARGYEEQAIRVEALEVVRPAGLTVGETSRCLTATLDVLLGGGA